MLKHLGSSPSSQKGCSEIGLGAAFVTVLFVSAGDREGGEDTIDPPDSGSVATAATAAAAVAFPLSISVTSTYVHQPDRYSTRRLVSLDSTAHSFRRTSTVTRERACRHSPTSSTSNRFCRWFDP